MDVSLIQRKTIGSVTKQPKTKMFFVPNNKNTFSFKDKSLCFATYSIGNVGQLATDLLLLNYPKREFIKIGYISHPALRPMVGADAFSGAGLSLGMEVYLSENIVVIQLRTQMIAKEVKTFFEDFNSWISKENFSSIQVFSSCDSCFRNELDNKKNIVFITNSNSSFSPSFLENTILLVWDEKLVDRKFIGSGLLSKLILSYFLYSKELEHSISFSIFFAFCNEGDNIADAQALCRSIFHLNGWEIPENGFQLPVSWNMMYGEKGKLL